MMRHTVRIVLATALGGFVLAAGGCGSGGGGSTTTTTATETTTTETATTSATTTNAIGSLGSLLTSKNCRDLANTATSFSQAIAGTGKADFKQAAQLMKEFADKTPEDIRPDFEVLADAYAKYADALQGVDLRSGKAPSAAVIAKMQKLSTEIDTAKLAQASQHISAWVQTNCTSG
jgi:hypothetical protein